MGSPPIRNMRRKVLILSLAIAALILASGCTGPYKNDAPNDNGVFAYTSKSKYTEWENVEIILFNNSKDSIYYTWGCRIPGQIYLVENGERTSIISITPCVVCEYSVEMLEPGESQTFIWSQKKYENNGCKGVRVPGIYKAEVQYSKEQKGRPWLTVSTEEFELI